jgi:hypothetical protein
MQTHAYRPQLYVARAPVDPQVRAAEKRILELVRPSVGPLFAGLIAGAAAGASVGIWDGPLSAIVGALVGSLVGALSGLAVEYVETRSRLHNARLDRDIGVIGGDLGAGRALRHEDAQAGLYSAASMGRASWIEERAPAEGPMEEPA